VRGELAVERYGDAEELLNPGSELIAELRGRPELVLTVETSRPHKRGWLVFFEGVNDRDAAEAIAGSTLLVGEDRLPPLEEGAYYHYQLEGLEVVTEEGASLGRVESVLETGANDVLSVRGPKGEVLLPVIDSVVREIDPEGGRIVVALIPGLVPEDP
jgi:16S rRNA processing protein RimM